MSRRELPWRLNPFTASSAEQRNMEYDGLRGAINGPTPEIPTGSESFAPLIYIQCRRCGAQIGYTEMLDGRSCGGVLHYVLHTQEEVDEDDDSVVDDVATLLTSPKVRLWKRQESVPAFCRSHGVISVPLSDALQRTRDSLGQKDQDTGRKWRL